MSDTTIASNGGDATGQTKPFFRVPFLSGRIPQPRTTNTISNKEVPSTPMTSTVSETVSPEAKQSETPQVQVTEVVQVDTPSSASQQVAQQARTTEGLQENVSDTPVVIVQKAELNTESRTHTPSQEKQMAPTDAGITLGLAMLEIVAKLHKDQDDFFVTKERGSFGTVLKLIQRREAVSLSFMEPKEKMSFCLAFLTAAISRSSATLLETSFLMIPSSHSPEAFISGLISFKKDDWEEMRAGGLPDETSAILALAPLLTLLSLQDIFSRKNGTNSVASPEKKGELLTTENTQDIVQVGEDIWTVVRDQLKKILPETTDSEIQDKESTFNALIKTAVDEIQKNGRVYGIEGGVRILIAGNIINRKAIYDLLIDIQKRIASVSHPPKVEKYTMAATGSALLANELNALQSIAGGVGIAAPLTQTQTTPPENTMSAVDEFNGDTVKKIFLDDAFVKIVKLVCKVGDTTNIETCFRKYASLTMKDFAIALQKEEPLIQSEVASFINWAKNSYLKEKIPVLNNMTLLLVLTLVERGVSGSLARNNA